MAVTTVAGNSTIENVTRNAQAILDLIGTSTPLFSGFAQPLSRELVTATVHGESGLAGFDTSEVNSTLTGDAPERIAEIIQQNPHEVTVLCLGPLSNVARAFLKSPLLLKLVQQVVIMGGAVNVPGNMSRVSEFNFFVDPEAADIVLQSPVPKILVPLDACNQVLMQLEDFQQLHNQKLQKILAPMMQHFFAGLSKDEGALGVKVYDALAAYSLLNPSACTTVSMDVRIETTGTLTAGMCVVERRPSKERVNVEAVMKVDEEKFRREFIKILSLYYKSGL